MVEVYKRIVICHDIAMPKIRPQGEKDIIVGDAMQLGVHYAAKKHGVNPTTVYRWIKKGTAKRGMGHAPESASGSLPPNYVKQFQKLRRLRSEGEIEPEEEELVARALQRMIDVMEQRVPPSYASFVLNAAVKIREEALGMMTSKVEVRGKLTLAAALDAMSEPVKKIETVEARKIADPKLVKQLEQFEGTEDAEIVDVRKKTC